MSSPSNGEHDWKYRGWGERDEMRDEREREMRIKLQRGGEYVV